MPDARSGQRFPLRLPIAIEGRRKSAAFTHDLSASSVFISGVRPLKLGSRLKFRITLPREMLGVKRAVTVLCAGRVVRIDQGRTPRPRRSAPRRQMGIACVIDDYRFLRSK